jgi:hypothetical protein
VTYFRIVRIDTGETVGEDLAQPLAFALAVEWTRAGVPIRAVQLASAENTSRLAAKQDGRGT